MKNLKGIFAGQSASSQLVKLVLLVLAGMFLSTFLGMLLLMGTQGTNVDPAAHPGLFRLVQFLSSVGTFLLPALIIAWLCSENPRIYLSLGQMPKGKVLWYLFLIYILLTPVMSLTQYLNMQMALPEFMRPIEDWMRAQEEAAERLTLALIGDGAPLTLLANLLVIAVTAAVAEEFFFRGAVQRILGRWMPNPHAVIWVTAILFSAIHLQFYGFIPRLLIGAYLGYLLFWSRNIWVPVIAHFLNNAVAVIGLSNSDLKEMEYFNGELNPGHLIFYAIVSAIALLLLIPVIRRLRSEFDL
ncbi:CPBP family intramembrane glutamic endopeptidase [Parabacteroides sp. PF5-6]|uniref:CPBP family intramembrane glutamic endopeptidase n=1 Tax=Parabacteroides sp. PF5-6 TaxID=1742403 RepID=UPI00240705C7|nr:CPBP family intramembrane glutamic endopeptidase [Parabacteroides sp. PF5-6]MDF9831577.1 membrane protease YdiL (CAAX protease family) [Parabacteroides sp. PF5-6]